MKPKNGAIYAIENKINGKMYIGLSKNIRRRFKTHKNKLERGCHFNQHLQNAYNKYGKESFKFKVIEKRISVEKLGQKEKYYIDKFDTVKSGYNMKTGGYEGWKFSEEVKKKISKSREGMKLSQQHKESIGAFFRGCTLKKEHRNKISKALKGRSFTKEHKNNISAAMSGRESSFYNKYKTKETKLKASPVTKNEGVEIYNKYNNEKGYSYRKLADIYNIGKTTVERIVRGEHTTTKHLSTPEKQKSYLDKKEAQNIFDEYHKKGKTTKEIIADHGFTISTICRVVSGDHWATAEMEVE